MHASLKDYSLLVFNILVASDWQVDMVRRGQLIDDMSELLIHSDKSFSVTGSFKGR